MRRTTDGLPLRPGFAAFVLCSLSRFPGGISMRIEMFRRLIRKVIRGTFAAYRSGQSLSGWWSARRRLQRLAK
jgi:hypothetical protein